MNLKVNKDEGGQTDIAVALSHLLADTAVLKLQTQNYHWNFKGSNFHQLHLLFETQYREMEIAIDIIAERIRSLGHKTPGSFKEFLKLTSIDEDGDKWSPYDMLSSLINGNKTIAKKAYEASVIARNYDDEVSSSILISRINIHEKNIWILKSIND